MTRISEELVRKRSEHNDCEIFSLEELSLHQQDIEKIEHLDRWCRDLKILYLQSNLIDKIENVGRLKKLEYLNLALNNIEKIENLEGCESLTKLDLTVNFVGELTSIESLRHNHSLEEIYLTGNPCVNFKGYRDYVIAALPQLKRLDGKEVEKSERIVACQKYEAIKSRIECQQREYRQTRRAEKEAAEKEAKMESDNGDGTTKPDEKENEDFWNQKCDYTPESRKLIQEKLRENREKGNQSKPEKSEMKRQRRYFNDNGEPMNVNEAKVDFTLTETEDDSGVILDVACFKFLDTSLIDVDVQPNYVRVSLKGKILQLVLTDEVCPDKCTAHRSQTTGHLLLTMPKLDAPVRPLKLEKKPKSAVTDRSVKKDVKSPEKNHQKLEYDSNKSFEKTLANIATDQPLKPHVKQPLSLKRMSGTNGESPDKDFVDDPDVPPLI